MPLWNFKQTRRDLNNTHQLLVYADVIILLGKGMNATKKITLDSLIASNTAGQEVNKLKKCDIITKIWDSN
jgi:hypothetical protein